MGVIHAEIELINGVDLGMVQRNLMGKDDVRRITVQALVDTGSYMLAINENIQQYLDLPIAEKRNAQLANGEILQCDVVSTVELKFKNRRTMCNAIVLPGDSEVLLGSIPLEDMDVLIHPLRQELMVNPDHPTMAQIKLK
jgi:clan AA aspartic protease